MNAKETMGRKGCIGLRFRKAHGIFERSATFHALLYHWQQVARAGSRFRNIASLRLEVCKTQDM